MILIRNENFPHNQVNLKSVLYQNLKEFEVGSLSKKINQEEKHMKKKIIALLFASAMVMALAACGGNNSSTNSESTTTAKEAATEASTEAITDSGEAQAIDEDWYKAVLADESIKAKYPYYNVADINLDGVDELFLSTTDKYFIGGEDKACLMANVNGEPKTLQEIGEAGGEYWEVNQSDATLTYFSRLSGEGHIVLYKLENGELKEVSTADSYGPHHYHEYDNDNQLYFIDGDEVTEEDYDSYFEQYANEAGAMTYKKY